MTTYVLVGGAWLGGGGRTWGEGALGEDVANLVPDSVFDLFVPARKLASLDGEAFGGYLSGPQKAGWEGGERTVRLGPDLASPPDAGQGRP